MTRRANRRILVADDEPLIALMVTDMLGELGATAIGPVCSLRQALAAIEAGGFDGAILDVNLGDGMSYEAARILRDREIPFCFATGYGAETLPDDLQGTPVLGKPYRMDMLAHWMDAAFGQKEPPPVAMPGEVRDCA